MANAATASTTTSVVRYEVRISGIPTSYDAKQRVDEVLARISKFNGCFFDMCDFKMGRMATHGFLKFPGPQCASTILALVQSWGPSLDGQSWMCDLTPSIERSRYASTSEWQERDSQPPLWHATRVAKNPSPLIGQPGSETSHGAAAATQRPQSSIQAPGCQGRQSDRRL